MTEGNPFRVLSLFAIPILAGNLLHQAYSVTDSIVVGQCLGQTALAAVGCTAPISMLLAALMIGVTIGVGILISQAYGKRDHEQIRQYLTNGLYLSLMIALFIALGGGPFDRQNSVLDGNPCCTAARCRCLPAHQFYHCRLPAVLLSSCQRHARHRR